MAGVLSFDCSGLSYRRILAMWLSKTVYDWNHTAAMRHTIAQSQSAKPLKFSDFHPLMKEPSGARYTPEDLETVKGICESVFSKNKSQNRD